MFPLLAILINLSILASIGYGLYFIVDVARYTQIVP